MDCRSSTSTHNRQYVSRVIHFRMAEVSIRDLRNHGGEVVEPRSAGEQLTITRGKPVSRAVVLRASARCS